ncbi:hypothetical protein Taro_035639, partial [Colocasia esculenta]|nr:hypothetical protein [Colocasia esculenta]
LPISDQKHAELLQLQEVLLTSLSLAFSSLSSSSESHGRSFCVICTDIKLPGDMFRNESCPHSFCNDCIGKHIGVRVQESVGAVVNCPGEGCESALWPPLCRGIIPEEVFQRWVDALCESVLQPERRVYCPYRDCSELLVDDGVEVVRQSECPSCRRLFCAHCQVPWHADFECEEFQSLGSKREDLMVVELAKSKKWKRCPQCMFYVEKTDGCLHISCRYSHLPSSLRMYLATFLLHLLEEDLGLDVHTYSS